MAQAETIIGNNESGSTDECQRCGGLLRVLSGTDPDESLEGFVEECECQSCGRKGKMQYKSHSDTQTFVGACAEY